MINPYQQYQNNAVNTASPQQLTLMLYNGAIKFCNQAISAMEAKQIQKAHINIIKVQNIVVELQSTLDFKYPIAQEMDKLYEFIKQLLVEANIEKNKQKIEDAKELISDFRDVWQDIIKKG